MVLVLGLKTPHPIAWSCLTSCPQNAEISVNSGLAKNSNIGEHYRLRFESTFTNVINRSNFAPRQNKYQQSGYVRCSGVRCRKARAATGRGPLALRLDF